MDTHSRVGMDLTPSPSPMGEGSHVAKILALQANGQVYPPEM
jgi:hypothetical protein